MRGRTIAAVLLVALPSWAASQVSPAKADSFFVASDWKNAAQAYATITQREPTNGMAWFRLAASRQALGELDAAILPLEKARDLKFQVVSAEFRLARIYALKNDPGRALDALDRSVAGGLGFNSPITVHPDLASIREQPRYKKIVADLEHAAFPCRSGPEQQQFNFWIGKWDVFAWNPNGPNGSAQLGSNDVEAILERCVLLENWTPTGGVPGAGGKSMNFWDVNRRQWRQVWVAAGGGSLDYAGSFRDGAMRFVGWTLGPQGQKVLQKLTFFAIAKDTVRQLFESSTDSGKTWQPGFDARYVRRK
jgi:hypothetical protein